MRSCLKSSFESITGFFWHSEKNQGEKTQGKNSKLKLIPYKVSTYIFSIFFLTFLCQLQVLRDKHERIGQNSRKKLKTPGKISKSRHLKDPRRMPENRSTKTWLIIPDAAYLRSPLGLSAAKFPLGGVLTARVSNSRRPQKALAGRAWRLHPWSARCRRWTRLRNPSASRWLTEKVFWQRTPSLKVDSKGMTEKLVFSSAELTADRRQVKLSPPSKSEVEQSSGTGQVWSMTQF